jgi:multicomponent Na+:H+ antiporter subunit C
VDLLISHFNYFVSIALMMIGLHAMMAKMNLVKKLIGMNIFQWSIILFFVSTGAKYGATIPIVEGGHGHHGAEVILQASDYVNPLPHVLMLTAIVVGVATTGVALALLLRIYRTYHTLEEDEILKQLR